MTYETKRSQQDYDNFIKAIKESDKAAIKKLIQDGVHPAFSDGKEESLPIHYLAIHHSNLDILRTILQSILEYVPNKDYQLNFISRYCQGIFETYFYYPETKLISLFDFIIDIVSAEYPEFLKYKLYPLDKETDEILDKENPYTIIDDLFFYSAFLMTEPEDPARTKEWNYLQHILKYDPDLSVDHPDKAAIYEKICDRNDKELLVLFLNNKSYQDLKNELRLMMEKKAQLDLIYCYNEISSKKIEIKPVHHFYRIRKTTIPLKAFLSVQDQLENVDFSSKDFKPVIPLVKKRIEQLIEDHPLKSPESTMEHHVIAYKKGKGMANTYNEFNNTFFPSISDNCSTIKDLVNLAAGIIVNPKLLYYVHHDSAGIDCMNAAQTAAVICMKTLLECIALYFNDREQFNAESGAKIEKKAKSPLEELKQGAFKKMLEGDDEYIFRGK